MIWSDWIAELLHISMRRRVNKGMNATHSYGWGGPMLEPANVVLANDTPLGMRETIDIGCRCIKVDPTEEKSVPRSL